MRPRTRTSSIRSCFIDIITLAVLSAIPATAQAQTTATLDILNPPDNAGNIVISKGTSVEVEFNVTGDSNKNDELQLIRVDDASVVSKKKRGNNTTGTVNLHTNAANAIAELRVEYVHAGAVVASAADSVIVVADEGSVVLSEQIGDLLVVDQIQGTQISALDGRLTIAEADIDALEAIDLGTLPGDVAANTTNIGTNAGNIATNASFIASNDGDILALQGDVSTNAGNIADLQGDALTGFTLGSTALGFGALTDPNSTCTSCVAVGFNALQSNTSGSFNTATGQDALKFNTIGISNVAMGFTALEANTSGSGNTAVGRGAMVANTTGFINTAVGGAAMQFNTEGAFNTALGNDALKFNTTGGSNTALGFNALRNATGASNTAIGAGAGVNLTTGDKNLYLGSPGVAVESNTIRLGFPLVHTRFFSEGIYNVTPAGATTETVVIDSNGQLGSVVGNVGANATAITTNATAIGVNNLAIAGNSAAIGNNTTAIGANGVAIGVNAEDIDALEALDLGTLSGVVANNLTDIGNL